MRIGVLCSGGDAPGMNACVRAVVRTATASGQEVVGICDGYQGVLDSVFYKDNVDTGLMNPRSVSNIIQRGGTILRSRRCDEFRTKRGLARAADSLSRSQIDGLIVIGGDGTFRGAVEISEFWNGPIVGCPGTIDNDLCGTDFTIGFSTAVATAVAAIDKLRDTAESHQRMFLVEVMGRRSGHLALHTAVAAGAEIVCVPETPTNIQQIVEHITELKRRKKSSIIILVAEGDEEGGAEQLDRQLRSNDCPFSTRAVTLGHIQRGGSPTPADRILASKLGDFAARSLIDGAHAVMAGETAGNLVLTPFEKTFQGEKPLPAQLLDLVQRMSC